MCDWHLAYHVTLFAVRDATWFHKLNLLKLRLLFGVQTYLVQTGTCKTETISWGDASVQYQGYICICNVTFLKIPFVSVDIYQILHSKIQSGPRSSNPSTRLYQHQYLIGHGFYPLLAMVYKRRYASFTEEWSVYLARGSRRGDEGLSIDGAPLPSIDEDARIWAEQMLLKCFSMPFARVRALLIAEMIDKGEVSMVEAFTRE
ncbi:hypothetical protein F2Q69_00048523 [Brassica cretica]|uniref:Uncharacterized protein n=1 Tax=Brassica cretica TaxID=69181 RepID=A0A8S9Q5S3_BRACR|nr:hypothetical protein F2Q69_00048523 [Brassica cretica]